MAQRNKTLLLILALLLFTAIPGPHAAGGSDDLTIPTIRYTLDNGLRVVLSPNKHAPTIGIAVFYNVGSKVEEKGRSGFAHLFEHMMFQGSENVPKTGHFKIITSHGGSFNGTTGVDYTNYFEELPAQMLPVALWLEADRMRSLKVNQENFDNQRSVVIEEKLRNYDNQPYVPSYLEINRLAYEGWWPYEHSTIGDMKDLKNAQIEWVREFYYAYYNPANAVLSIAGNFEPDQAKDLVEIYFGDIPSPPETPAFDPPAFKGQKEEKYKVMVDPLAPLPAFHMTYHIPPMRSPDYYPLKLIAMALGEGESARLYQKLVKQKQSVQEMAVDLDGRDGPDLFSVFMILTGKESPGAVGKEVISEIEDIAVNGLTDKELTKVKNRIKMKYVQNINNNLHLSLMLAKYELLWQDAGLINSEVGRFMAITQEDIVQAAKKYLVEKNRTTLDVLPSEQESGLE